MAAGAEGNGGGDNGREANRMCSTANLVAPTPVLFADLSISSMGPNWDKVVLQVAPVTVPTAPDKDNDGD